MFSPAFWRDFLRGISMNMTSILLLVSLFVSSNLLFADNYDEINVKQASKVKTDVEDSAAALKDDCK